MVKYYSGEHEVRDDGIDTPTWVYHPTEAAKIVDAAEADTLLASGWFTDPDCTPTDRPDGPDGDESIPKKPAKKKA